MMNQSKSFFLWLGVVFPLALGAVGACRSNFNFSPVPYLAAEEDTLCGETILVDVQKRFLVEGEVAFSDWIPFETRIVSRLKDFLPRPIQWDKYGFPVREMGTRTGFFHTEKIAGRWWIIDPDGYAGMGIFVNSFSQGKSDRNKHAFRTLYGSTERWAQTVLSQLRKDGFNGVGSWSDVEAVRAFNETSSAPMSYCVMLNWMALYGKIRGGTYPLPGNTGYPNQCIFVFDPEFEQFCMDKAQELRAYRDDPNLFGYFSDNELPLSRDNLEGYLDLANENDPGRLAAEAWLARKGITRDQITQLHREEFVGVVAERYYSIVNRAIRSVDPNHMYLGSRLHASAPHIRTIVEACGRHVDIISINYYGHWQLRNGDRTAWQTWTDTPFQVTEFYTKGIDSGLPNTAGAGWNVRTQTDRGYAYQNMCLSFLESTHCVGWHWFKYQDNDPDYPYAEASNTDSNKGLVNNDYRFYTDLCTLMRGLNLLYPELIFYFSGR